MMGLDDLGKSLNDLGSNIGDGIKQAADAAQKETARFHEHYIKKLTPDLGKFNGAAKFAAEMAPGVSEYNALKAGDWTGLAVAAGVDLGATAAGAVSGGTGFAAIKGGTALGKATVKAATKEVAEATVKATGKEVTEAVAKKTVKEVAETASKGVAEDVVQATAERGVKGAAEIAKETTANQLKEGLSKTTLKSASDVLNLRSEQSMLAPTEKAALAKSIVGEGVNLKGKKVTLSRETKAFASEAEKKALVRTVLIPQQKFGAYLDQIVEITHRKIGVKQRALLEKYRSHRHFEKLSPEALKKSHSEFTRKHAEIISEWEKLNHKHWPTYKKDVVGKDGIILRKKGQPLDAHHIIEQNVGGPNKGWNIHPAKFPDEHQGGIHGKGNLANDLFKLKEK